MVAIVTDKLLTVKIDFTTGVMEIKTLRSEEEAVDGVIERTKPYNFRTTVMKGDSVLLAKFVDSEGLAFVESIWDGVENEA